MGAFKPFITIKRECVYYSNFCQFSSHAGIKHDISVIFLSKFIQTASNHFTTTDFTISYILCMGYVMLKMLAISPIPLYHIQFPSINKPQLCLLWMKLKCLHIYIFKLNLTHLGMLYVYSLCFTLNLHSLSTVRISCKRVVFIISPVSCFNLFTGLP